MWLGGLVGLLVIWRTLPGLRRVPALSVVVPRFSNVALVSVVVLAGTGIGEAIVHMPAVNALWETGFGQAMLVKTGLLIVALGSPRGTCCGPSRSWSPPRERPELGEPAARLLRRLISGEASSSSAWCSRRRCCRACAPPPPAFALQNSALASVGPATSPQTVNQAGYGLQVLVSPNKAAAPDSFALRITKNGQPVRGANVTLTFNHPRCKCPNRSTSSPRPSPAIYSRAAPALVMVGAGG